MGKIGCPIAEVAFSNAKGGKVYIGVSDKGKVQGITIGKESAQNWINEVKGKNSTSSVCSRISHKTRFNKRKVLQTCCQFKSFAGH